MIDFSKMNHRNALVGFVALIAVTALLLLWAFGRPQIMTKPDKTANDIAAGKLLYGTSCASCHGDKLQGQNDWRASNDDGSYPAPPHDESGHTWHHPDDMLFNYTKLGGTQALTAQGVTTFKSSMPAFGGQLTDTQILNVLAYIKSTWSERIIQMRNKRITTE